MNDTSKALESITIVDGQVQCDDLNKLWLFARTVVQSGLVPYGIRSPEAALVTMIAGARMGLDPMASLANLAPINGVPKPYGDFLLHRLVNWSGYISRSEWWERGGETEGATVERLDFEPFGIEPGDDLSAFCEIKYREPNDDADAEPRSIKYRYHLGMAEHSGLFPATDKGGRPAPRAAWNKETGSMLRRRALARCAARAWPMVVGGFGSVEDSNEPVSTNADVIPDRSTVDLPTFTFDGSEEGEPSAESKARHVEEEAAEVTAEKLRAELAQQVKVMTTEQLHATLGVDVGNLRPATDGPGEPLGWNSDPVEVADDLLRRADVEPLKLDAETEPDPDFEVKEREVPDAVGETFGPEDELSQAPLPVSQEEAEEAVEAAGVAPARKVTASPEGEVMVSDAPPADERVDPNAEIEEASREKWMAAVTKLKEDLEVTQSEIEKVVAGVIRRDPSSGPEVTSSEWRQVAAVLSDGTWTDFLR